MNSNSFNSSVPMQDITATGKRIEAGQDHAALETLSALLRVYGQHALDIESTPAEETQAACDQWARHLLYGAPVNKTLSSNSVSRANDRDWAGATRFFADTRRRENEHFKSSLDGTRAAFWSLADMLNKTLTADRENDAGLHNQIECLQAATKLTSFTEMRDSVIEAVGKIEAMAARRLNQQNLLIEFLQDRMMEMEERLQEARTNSQSDSLTGLLNRGALQIQMQRIVSQKDNSNHPACLILIDIDHFKKLNDSYGHPAGDACLRALADCLASSFPGRDDCVARYGGEEFAVLLPGVDRRAGQELAFRVVESVEKLSIHHTGLDLSFTISAGLAVRDRGESLDDWLERTDKALYRAKRAGRNRLEVAR